MPVYLKNKKVNYEYQILETFQAGLSLSGRMTKLIRNKKIHLQSKFIVFQKKQLQIIGLGNEELTENVPLLLKKREQIKIKEKLKVKGISCVVLEIKSIGRWLKAEIAIVKGKKTIDKRRTIKERDLDREMGREMVRGKLK